jgi:hypothetical protein
LFFLELGRGRARTMLLSLAYCWLERCLVCRSLMIARGRQGSRDRRASAPTERAPAPDQAVSLLPFRPGVPGCRRAPSSNYSPEWFLVTPKSRCVSAPRAGAPELGKRSPSPTLTTSAGRTGKTITSSGPPAFYPHLRVQAEARTLLVKQILFPCRPCAIGSPPPHVACYLVQISNAGCPDPYQRVRADLREQP